ncbi:MAG: zinc ribbon domain-containing protein [Bacilli bacterium]|nr:zinc ribbon domain-containing protein [Bacilli bacterium]MBN2876498.1 zinc ribbon domain-containing protein [Bacilli bacterium]
MAYCKNCGQEIHNDAVICPHCGVAQKELSTTGTGPNDVGGIGWGLLGFCVPVAGLVLYLIWKDDKPLNAKAAGIGALASVGVAILVYIIYFVFIISILGAY